MPIALALLVVVAALTWPGHGGRALFAMMTLLFIAVATVVLLIGFVAPHGRPLPTRVGSVAPHWPPLAVLLAFPVGMALATGVEAPSSAIAQLAQLGDAGRRAFGRVTLWLTLATVAWLTLGLAALAVRLRVGVPLPSESSTQIAEVARAATGSGGLFVAFQLSSSLLLLAAASSSFQAGPGLLKALSRNGGSQVGILPPWLGRANRHHTPYWGVVVFLLASAAIVLLAGGRDQELVLFYAVAVFVSFLAGLLAMAAFSRRERAWRSLIINATGALDVGVTLLGNVARGLPVISLVAAFLIAAGLYRLWIRAGRPHGVSEVERLAEEEIGEDLAGDVPAPDR